MIAAQLTLPTLTHANVEGYMIQMLVGKDSIQHQLYASIIGYKDGILEAFHSQMLQYHQEDSVYYRNEKNGDKDASSSLLPKVGDFCIFKDGGQKTHFGIIDELLTGSQENVVKLRMIKRGKVTQDVKNFVNIQPWRIFLFVLQIQNNNNFFHRCQDVWYISAVNRILYKKIPMLHHEKQR